MTKIILIKLYHFNHVLSFIKKIIIFIHYQKLFFHNTVPKNIKIIVKFICTIHFGSNDSRGNLIETWINNLLLNKPINIYSNNTMVNLTNADFIAKTLFNIDKIPPGNYSLRSEVTISLIELALFLKKLTNSKSKIINLKK